MKKIVTILLVAVMVVSAVFALVACDTNKSEVEKAIEAAQKMTLEELEAASKAEMEANPAVQQQKGFRISTQIDGCRRS